MQMPPIASTYTYNEQERLFPYSAFPIIFAISCLFQYYSIPMMVGYVSIQHYTCWAVIGSIMLYTVYSSLLLAALSFSRVPSAMGALLLS